MVRVGLSFFDYHRFFIKDILEYRTGKWCVLGNFFFERQRIFTRPKTIMAQLQKVASCDFFCRLPTDFFAYLHYHDLCKCSKWDGFFTKSYVMIHKWVLICLSTLLCVWAKVPNYSFFCPPN